MTDYENGLLAELFGNDSEFTPSEQLEALRWSLAFQLGHTTTTRYIEDGENPKGVFWPKKNEDYEPILHLTYDDNGRLTVANTTDGLRVARIPFDNGHIVAFNLGNQQAIKELNSGLTI